MVEYKSIRGKIAVKPEDGVDTFWLMIDQQPQMIKCSIHLGPQLVSTIAEVCASKDMLSDVLGLVRSFDDGIINSIEVHKVENVPDLMIR